MTFGSVNLVDNSQSNKIVISILMSIVIHIVINNNIR